MATESVTQSVHLPVHLHAYLHANERINIAGLFRKAIREEMRRDGINVEEARKAFSSSSDDGSMTSSDITTELTTTREYQQFVRTNTTHEQQTPLDN